MFGAAAAVDAFCRIGREPQRGPFHPVSQESADHHQRRHPAQMVAEGPSSRPKTGQHDEQKQNDQVGDKGPNIADGQAVRGAVKEIHRPMPPGSGCQKRDHRHPRYPDDPIDEVTPDNPFVPGQKHGFLAAGSRTDPPAIAAAKTRALTNRPIKTIKLPLITPSADASRMRNHTRLRCKMISGSLYQKRTALPKRFFPSTDHNVRPAIISLTQGMAGRMVASLRRPMSDSQTGHGASRTAGRLSKR